MSLLALLISGHIIGDFAAQPTWLAGKKAEHTRWMLVHGLVVMAAHAAMLALFWSIATAVVVVLLAGAHFIVDVLNRAYAKRWGSSLTQFLVDQGVHFVSLLVAWHVLRSLPLGGDPQAHSLALASEMGSIALVFAGFVAITRGGSTLLDRLFLAHPELVPETTGESEHQLAWGRTAGCIERSLFFTLVLLGQWVALGLVVAAKFWRGGPKIEKVQEEYYRSIGFMASILIAVIVGALVRLLLIAH